MLQDFENNFYAEFLPILQTRKNRFGYSLTNNQSGWMSYANESMEVCWISATGCPKSSIAAQKLGLLRFRSKPQLR